jgi:anti-anti-sigma factor
MQPSSVLDGCTAWPNHALFTPQESRVAREMAHLAKRVAAHWEEYVSHYCLTHKVTDIDGAGDVVVVVGSGEIDCGASPQLRELVHRQIALGARRLVLDLSMVSFIDSTAIGVIVSAAARLKATGDGCLSVACVEENTRVMRILDIAGLASQILVYRSRQEALAALTPAAESRWPVPTTTSTPPSQQRAHDPRSPLLAARRYAQQAAATWRDPAGGAGDRPSRRRINETA